MGEVHLQRDIESLRAHNEQLLGKLADATQALEAFSTGQVDAVMLASSSTPLLLHAAQLEARIESAERLRISQQLRALVEASRDFAEATDDYARLLDKVAHTLAVQTNCACVVSLLSEDGEMLDGVAAYSVDDADETREARQRAVHCKISDDPQVRQVLSGKAWNDLPLNVERTPSGATPTSTINGGHFRLLVALRVRGGPLGLLALTRVGDDATPFDARDHELAQTLADHAALAISNARSYAAERAARATAENATKALRSAEGRLRRLSESGLIGIVVGDAQGVIEEANDAFLGMLGYSRDEILSERTSWKDLTAPESHASDALAVVELTESGVAALREKECIHKDGRRVPVLVGSAMLDGETTKSVSFLIDLTERKASQAAIERLRQDGAADARFRALIESAPEAMVVVGADGLVVIVNGQFERLFGYSREEIIGRPIEGLLPERFRGGHPGKRAEYAQEPSVRPMGQNTDIYAQRKDGTEFPVEVSLSPLESGGAHLVSSAIRDITERKRNDEQRSRLAAIVNSSYDAIIGKTLDGVITSWNRGAELTFGYDANEVVGKSIGLLVPLERRREQAGILFEVALGNVQHLDTVRQMKGGRVIDVSLTISPVYDARGRVVGVSDVARDVSDRKRNELSLIEARDAAMAANRELETFSYSVAHDLRAPLRGMAAFAELLSATYSEKLDDEGKDWLQEITGGARRMATLIDALLALSRVSRSELKREAVDLSAIARAIGSRLAAAEQEGSVELAIAENLWADIDPRLALVLLENLLGNAFKFTGKVLVRRIEFAVTERSGARIFFVRDNGAGFDMAFADKLFVPFQRLHSAGQFPGTGVGLATVQRIVRRHGGEIWAEGVVGGGATFFFTLPSRADEAPR